MYKKRKITPQGEPKSVTTKIALELLCDNARQNDRFRRLSSGSDPSTADAPSPKSLSFPRFSFLVDGGRS
jgi:hypothetical protein